MRTISGHRPLLFALIASAVVAAPAFAQSPGAPPASPLDRPSELPAARNPPPPQEPVDQPAARKEPTIDELFADLAAAKDDRSATAIADRIQRRLASSGSATIDVLMGQAHAAIGAENLPVALDLLDAVTRLKPDFAEGWSRRAAVHYQRDDFGKALADLEHALVLEPRDWRTLVGLATVLKTLDREEAALKAYEAALAVHPRSEEAKKGHDELEAEVRGLEL